MKRFKYSLSHYKLLTCNMGELIPLTWFEALPGDSFQHSTSALIRVAPLLTPVMHPVMVRIHHWFVPNRIIWDDWEDFITGGPDGTSTPSWPYFATTSLAEGSLSDYLGMPGNGAFGYTANFSALPARAYATIFNNFYRDQDLVTEVTVDTTSGSDTTTPMTTVQNVAWPKDYYTVARPWTQKGTEVTISLGTDCPVTGIGGADQTYPTATATAYETDGSSSVTYANADATNASNSFYIEQDPNNTGYPNIRADLSSATGISINDLRESIALQKYMERSARFGSRYPEYLRSLGIRSPARLQEPTYLGGGRQVIQFSEVVSTSEDGTREAGILRGHGISAMRTNRYRKFIDEHGIIMTLMSVIPKPIYGDGAHKAFYRDSKEDYFQKELQFIGDEIITNKEIKTDHATPDGTFGYSQRYDSYRYLPSTISGEFRSSKNDWHYSRIYASDPSLNSSWVTCTPTKRVNADSSADCLHVMANHSVQARRIVSKSTNYKVT